MNFRENFRGDIPKRIRREEIDLEDFDIDTEAAFLAEHGHDLSILDVVNAELPDQRKIKLELARKRLEAWISDNEIKKTPELNEMIEEVIGWVSGFSREHGGGSMVELNANRVHLFTKENFDKEFDEGNFEGIAYAADNEVYVSLFEPSILVRFNENYSTENISGEKDTERIRGIHDVALLTHELTHLVGYQKAYSDKSKDYYLRSGFRIPRIRKGEYHYDALTSLNEAVVDIISIKLVREKMGEIKIGEKRIDDIPLGGYERDVEILELIIDGIAKHEGRPPEEIQDQFIEKYFSGDILFLKVIKQVFGEEAYDTYLRLEPRFLDDDDYYEEVKYLFRSF